VTDYCECGGIGPYRCDWCKQKDQLTVCVKELREQVRMGVDGVRRLNDIIKDQEAHLTAANAKVEKLREALNSLDPISYDEISDRRSCSSCCAEQPDDGSKFKHATNCKYQQVLADSEEGKG